MNPIRSQPLSLTGLLIVFLVLSLVAGLPMGRAQEGGPGVDPYPPPSVELPTEASAYPAPGEEPQPGDPLDVPGIPLSTPHDSFLADLDGEVVLVHERAGARRQDAQEYVKRFGVSLDEAYFRLDLQEAIGKLGTELMVSEADIYAGMWIQHEPDFRVIIRFTERGEETLLPYLADSPLAELVEVRGASITLAVLAEEQQALGEALQGLGIPHESYLDEVENRVVLLVLEPAELETALVAASVTLPAFVEVNQVESFAQDEADIYGGLEASVQCVQAGLYSYPTTGFNLVTTTGTIYASTTGHACRGAGGSVNMTVNGLSYPFVARHIQNLVATISNGTHARQDRPQGPGSEMGTMTLTRVTGSSTG
jgi:hypothetical protein